MWEKTCLVCDSINTATTFTAEACQETFKIQSGPLTCDSGKVLHLLKWKVCGEVLYLGKAKTKFRHRFSNYKSKQKRLEKVIEKFLRSYFTLTIVLMTIAASKIGIL